MSKARETRYAVSVTLTKESIDYIEACMRTEGFNRSDAVNYLVRMGYIYVYKHMEEAKEGEK